MPFYLKIPVLAGVFCCASMAVAGNLDAVKNLPLADGKILSVERETAPEITLMQWGKEQKYTSLAPRTVVKILLQPTAKSNINVQVYLPDDERWNGRMVGLGNGGAAGSISPGGLLGWANQGYAAGTTDMGTAPNSDSGIGNPEVWKDFGFRATHLMTAVTKQVITAYYGKKPDFCYFSGGSTGGQQALQEAQRYPDDYDGILASIPAHCRAPLHAYFLWNFQWLKRGNFTQAQLDTVAAAGLEYMAAKEPPMLAGKVISDPRATAADADQVIALARQKDPSITDGQADILRKIFAGPTHAKTGKRIFDGVPLGSEINLANGHLYLFQWVFGKDKDLMSIDFGDDFDQYLAALSPYLDAENADLAPFAAHGGKLVIVSGTQDSIVPYHATLDYYERLIANQGSLDATRRFCRFYLIPGMKHGNGTAIPNMLLKVIEWREKGVAPGEIEAKFRDGNAWSAPFPVYPYPEAASYDAAGKWSSAPGHRGTLDVIALEFHLAPKE